ncbi:whirlin-like isoform X2 [Ruditapes philippinarum]|uniref:whirlin-like isoform X2 n=1 Tax=Ruditapes philippinarum TaxID=129788 RepID=UPI00295A677A|nr:whirlin-like isoform X2 [Ruditapes philippinarum]
MNNSLDRSSERSDRRNLTMSTSVRRLQDAINMHLDVSQKADFVDILNEFQINRDMAKFVRSLKILLDTPAKTQLLALIKKVIPKTDVEEFEHCVKGRAKKFDTMPVKLAKNQRSRPPLSTAGTNLQTDTLLSSKKQKKRKNIKSKEENQSSSSKNTSVGTLREKSKYSLGSVRSEGNNIKHIHIELSGDRNEGFGFSIRGGSEFGIGIYVSMIDKGGMAERKGLMPGDLLMEVNNISFVNISHDDAAKYIQSCDKLEMMISRVGRIPGSFTVHQMYKWVNGSGRPVSPPPELEQLGKVDSVGRKSGFSLLGGPDERKINITVGNGESLGIMIRGGREFGLGIYISGVDTHSLAEEAGMKIGDQILDVNERSFLDITHAEAVGVLKTSKYLMFTTKDVGKLPFARTKIDQTSWMSKNQQRKGRQRTESQSTDSMLTEASSKNSVFRKGIGSQLMYNTSISTKWDLIEKQALQLLNDTEQGTLRYYLSEYQAGFITVDGLAMASFELLNTKAKMTLMKEIRNWVQGRDLDKFDMLLKRRQALQRQEFKVHQKQGFSPHSFSTYSLDGHDQGISDRLRHPYKAMSAPASRASTLRERSGRVHKQVAEWELEPLRQAIEQIDDHIQSDNPRKPSRKKSALQRSTSTEFIHSPPPNLLKTSLSSRRSMSQETLIPVYIDTTSDLSPSPSPVHRPYNQTTSRPRSNSSSQRRKSGNSYSHRQRSGSNSSSLRRRYRSVEDVRSPKSKHSVADSASLSSQSYINLTRADNRYNSSHALHTIEADIHTPPTFHSHHADGSPSDDSGVDSGGLNVNDPANRVTISSDNPVNINDVLHNRSFVKPSSRDSSNHSNHSTLTNRSTRSHQSIATLNNHRQRNDDNISATSSPKNFPSHRNISLHPPVEIRINDGNGSIDTMSLDSQSSPQFMNALRKRRGRSLRGSMIESDDDEDDDVDDDVDDDQDTLEISSDVGDHTDFYVSSLDKVLDYEASHSNSESRQIKDAKKKYGEVPLYIIPVYKTKPTLGMAIEGGANTRQPVPRVISLQPGGSAYESGGLKVGHMILEVNGKSLIGLEHITAAKTVAEAFKNSSYDYMELLVTDSDVKIKLP